MQQSALQVVAKLVKFVGKT